MPAAVPDSLVELIAQGRCVLFVGPDAAETAGGYLGLPTSWQLANELAAASGYRGPYRPLPNIAQVYQHAHGRQNLVQFLRRRLDDPAYAPLPIHELIARIPFAIIVQAGWDQLLERALHGQGINPQVIQSVEDMMYVRPGSGLILYKPYGSLDRPAELVITEDDQLNVFYQLQAFKRRLAELMATYALFLVGYAADYDSVFVRIYHEIRYEQGLHRLPAFVVESMSRPQDALQWEARGITPLVAEPVPFLYELAGAVARAAGRAIDLPDPAHISQAPAVAATDLAAEARAQTQVLDTLGVTALVEQSELPLLSVSQVRDLEAMRGAYARLAESLAPAPESAQIWLRQGNIEYARENYDEAAAFYRRGLEARPDLAEAYYNLHYVYLNQKRLTEALDAYRQAVALQPDLSLLPPRYTIVSVVGRGGMGVVYRALDNETGQTVAVKLLDRSHMRTERVVARFRREAEILQRLRHPNVVDYLDAQPYQGRYFITMAYLGEESLASLLAAAPAGRLSLDRAYGIVRQMCDALVYIHSLGIIHRDIKPSNVFLVDGQVKLIDFGLAVSLDEGQPSTTGLATGTVAYMAPEQIVGGPVDGRTDIYAVATLFQEMISGYHPSQGAYRPLSELDIGLNDALEIVLQTARAREPAARYPDMQTFCRELARVVPLQPASHRASPPLRALSALQQAIRRSVMVYWPVVLGLIAAALLVSGAVFSPGLRAALRLAGVFLWNGLLLVILTDWFVAWLGRRSGYASLAAYGALLGLVLAWVITALTQLSGFNSVALASAPLDVSDYAVVYLTHSLLLLIVGAFSLLGMWAGSRLALRLHLPPLVGIVAGPLVVIGLYAFFIFAPGSILF